MIGNFSSSKIQRRRGVRVLLLVARLLRGAERARGPGAGLLRALPETQRPRRAAQGVRGHVQVVGEGLPLPQSPQRKAGDAVTKRLIKKNACDITTKECTSRNIAEFCDDIN